MFFKSIRFKIILWYMLILAITLGIFSAFVYHNFKRNVYEDIDDLLSSRAYGIAEAIDTYWETEKIEAKEDNADIAALNKTNDVNFARVAQHWVEERSSDPGLIATTVEIYDTEGHEIVASKNVFKRIGLWPETRSSVLEGNDHMETVIFESAGGKPLSFRVYAIPVIENEKISYIVQVARPLTVVEASFSRLKTVLFIFLPLTVFLTGIAGAFFARLTLRPVDQMIHGAHQITGENFSLRIKVPDTKDEIQRLAETFNEMLARLEGAFSSQNQFIQDISHELKTPLTILKGELEVALKKARSPQEYESLLASNLEEINRLSRIIEGLLTLARLDSMDIKLHKTAFGLSALLQKLMEDTRVLAQQKKIRIDFLANDETVECEADQNQIQRVFLNVLDNAIKYTPAGGLITLKLGKKDNWATVAISDTGIGIPGEDLPHVFERFYRVDKARSSAGFGLGLSISKSIVEAHQGKIEVESVPQKGTTVTIFLPLVFSH